MGKPRVETNFDQVSGFVIFPARFLFPISSRGAEALQVGRVRRQPTRSTTRDSSRMPVFVHRRTLMDWLGKDFGPRAEGIRWHEAAGSTSEGHGRRTAWRVRTIRRAVLVSAPPDNRVPEVKRNRYNLPLAITNAANFGSSGGAVAVTVPPFFHGRTIVDVHFLVRRAVLPLAILRWASPTNRILTELRAAVFAVNSAVHSSLFHGG